jgi:hypothetical protein
MPNLFAQAKIDFGLCDQPTDAEKFGARNLEYMTLSLASPSSEKLGTAEPSAPK